MRIIHDLDEMTETARGWLAGGPVGFVPTGGHLHAGHLSLVQAAQRECEFSVVSIYYMDRQQAGVAEDQNRPQPELAGDLQVLSNSPVDVVFIPRPNDLFPANFSTYVTPFGTVAERLEGAIHPHYMRNYATTITKLLQLVRPDVAYFGQKTAQQVALVRQVVRDLNIDVAVRILPTLRESDGMAVSSRSRLLSPAERQAASLLYQALLAGKALIEGGERQVTAIEKAMADLIATSPILKLEYAAVCDPGTFAGPGEVLATPLPDILLVIAARVGSVYLVDNILWRDGYWIT